MTPTSLFVASLAASAAAASGLHYRAAPAAAVERAASSATPAPDASSATETASSPAVSSAVSSSASFCCLPPNTKTIPASKYSSCNDKLISYLQNQPTQAPELASAFPSFTAGLCSFTAPANASSLFSEYNSQMQSYYEPRITAFNSFVQTECDFLSTYAVALVNGTVLDASCAPTGSTSTTPGSASASATATPAASGSSSTASPSASSSETAKSDGRKATTDCILALAMAVIGAVVAI